MSERLTIEINNRKRRVALPPEVVTVTDKGIRTAWALGDDQRYRCPGKRAATLDELSRRYEQVRWDDYVRELVERGP